MEFWHRGFTWQRLLELSARGLLRCSIRTVGTRSTEPGCSGSIRLMPVSDPSARRRESQPIVWRTAVQHRSRVIAVPAELPENSDQGQLLASWFGRTRFGPLGEFSCPSPQHRP
jgi:hypothetical protein